MYRNDLLFRSFVLLSLTLCMAPALAAGIDCGKVGGHPVAEAICQHPKLLKLDAQLSTAYAQALTRNPSRTAQIKEDQINWLGERNLLMWSVLKQDPDWGLPTPGQNELDQTLARPYELRIAFLRNLGDPTVTRGDPIAQKILAFEKTSSANDTVKALQSAGLLVLPSAHNTDLAGAEKLLARLAAPPSVSLRASLKGLSADASPWSDTLTVEYLPEAGIGGVYAMEGTALCQDWVLFEKHGNVTVARKSSDVDATIGCMTDGGSTEYPALLDHQPVMLAITDDNFSANQTDLEWQRWLDGDQWGSLTRLRLRYSYTISMGSVNPCDGAPARCAETASTALDVTRRYLRNPWTLPQVTTLTAAEHARFQRMMKDAPKRKDFGAIVPAWFPAHLSASLVVGGIDYMHLGSHIYTGSFDVGFWGQTHSAGPWWVVNQYPMLIRGSLLAAARIPPGKSH